MSKTITWYYRRNSCSTCSRSDEYIQNHGLRASKIVDARKEKLGKREIAQILRKTNRVVATKGKKILEWDFKREPPIEKALYEALLGPSGTLRAPAIRLGKTLVVGFTDEAWDKVFG